MTCPPVYRRVFLSGRFTLRFKCVLTRSPCTEGVPPMHRALLFAVLPLSVLFSTFVAAQDAEYTYTLIEVPGATDTDPHGINGRGQIVGLFLDATGTHGFVTSDGITFTTIDVPGAIS